MTSDQHRFRRSSRYLLVLGAIAALPHVAVAQSVQVAPLVVTGTRSADDPKNLPMSIDVVGAEVISQAGLQVNLSESMQRVPGVNIQNRSNYAQDLQISARGFGGRASFGVRGIRLFTDGIPATQPDGQGQVSHFALSSADRIEVLRGPFSVLYGNASGGVISVFTETGDKPIWATSVAGGGNGTARFGVKASGQSGALNYLVDLSRFRTDGFRPQSAAERTSGNLKLGWQAGAATKVTLVANSVDVPEALDPLGLTRGDFDANPDSVASVATQFNTRKSVRQMQAGVKVEHALTDAWGLEALLYGGTRDVQQFQAIPVATQTPANHPGGVIDFSRAYAGVDLRALWKQPWGRLVIGANFDQLDEDRLGYENFVGTGANQVIGVLGRLRRDESNRVRNGDFYGQAEILVTDALRAHVGVRHSNVRFRTQDHYVVGSNPDDSGAVSFSKTTPVAGLSFEVMPALSLYATAGQGFETPTFNELAYRASGQTGLNFDLKPAVSASVEVGAKYRAGRIAANLALFETRTKDEIVTLTNAGGRSTFQNAGRTLRRGAELFATATLAPQWDTTLALTHLRATYRDDFTTCTGVPCTTPTTVVPGGNNLPGVPGTAVYGELRWWHPMGLSAALEIKHQGKLYVNDLNTDAAAAYTIGSARVLYTFSHDRLKVDLGLRVDNIADKRYAGSVIVNEGNGRFFETAPGRTFLASIGLRYTL